MYTLRLYHFFEAIMSITIEAVNYLLPRHQQHLIMLLNAYALDPMGGNEQLLETTKQQLCAEMAKRDNVFSFIAYVDEQPAALCNCVEGFSTFKAQPLMNIHDIAVLAEFRGLGLSHKLLQEVELFAKQRGCCKLTLEVLEGNEIAKASYQKFGFEGYELDPKLGQAMFWEKPFK